MPSRLISDLVPEMQEKFHLFAGKMAEAGIPFMITRTKATPEEQAELYAQGRTKPGLIVTWTLKSKHLEGKAFDIAILKDGKSTWEPKVSVNKNEVPDYFEAGQIGESIGLEWGGRWKRRDLPHFQLKEAV